MAISAWRQGPVEDEWVFEKFRSDVVDMLSSSEAFDSIGVTVNALLAEIDESTTIQLLQTLIGLAGRSETTEMPRELAAHWLDLIKQVSSFGGYAKSKLKELAVYYREDASL